MKKKKEISFFGSKHVCIGVDLEECLIVDDQFTIASGAREFFSKRHFEVVDDVREPFATVHNNKYEFFLISMRDGTLQEQTENWAEQYFPGVFSRVILCSDKLKKCEELGITIMIDDQLDKIKCPSSRPSWTPNANEERDIPPEKIDWYWLDFHFITKMR